MKAARQTLPTSIWVLGCVSLLMDVSSEMIHSLLPLFLAGPLGASAVTIGLLEGVAEATALIVKVFSGVLSDYLGKRKWLVVCGYGLGAVTKPLFALAGPVSVVTTARLLDRVGKGIRGAPRDALVADLVPEGSRGAAYGLRQSLDTVGALLGPLLAAGLMLWWANDFRSIFWVAFLPGVLAVGLLIWGIRDPEATPRTRREFPVKGHHLARLSRRYWWVVALGAVFTLARFSEAFLVLRAEDTGMALAVVPLVMVVMNLVYALAAYPFGRLSDRLSKPGMLLAGMGVLIAADLVMAFSESWPGFLVGVALWGLHMGMTQGLLAALVADAVPADLRGKAFGFFNLVSGVAMLLASLIAGILWDRFGPSFTFYAGAGFAALASLLMLVRGFNTRHGYS